MHHRPRQDDPPFHPAGEGSRPFVALVGQREGLEQLLGALAALALGHPEIAGVVVERLLDGQEPVEVDLLRGQADRLARLFVVGDRVVAEDLDRARGHLRQTGRAVDQGRLAGAVGAEQAEQLARLDLERDPLQRLDSGRVAFDQILDLEGVVHPGESMEPRASASRRAPSAAARRHARSGRWRAASPACTAARTCAAPSAGRGCRSR